MAGDTPARSPIFILVGAKSLASKFGERARFGKYSLDMACVCSTSNSK